MSGIGEANWKKKLSLGRGLLGGLRQFFCIRPYAMVQILTSSWQVGMQETQEGIYTSQLLVHGSSQSHPVPDLKHLMGKVH